MKNDKKPSVFSGVCYALLFAAFNLILPVTVVFSTISNFVTPFYVFIILYLVFSISVNVLFVFVIRNMLNEKPVMLGIKIPLFLLTALTFIQFIFQLMRLI
ncbi:MAG: hypothetical protein IKH51_07250 [Clostridia bacterium]|nr:hypothetical protein [Clostridia bacterium]